MECVVILVTWSLRLDPGREMGYAEGDNEIEDVSLFEG